LTFHIPRLFRTELGIDLLVQGKFIRPGGAARPDHGEPIRHISRLTRGAFEAVEPE